MEEAANAGYVVILDKGSNAAEGTPFELKNDYVQDIVSVYGVSEDEIKSLNRHDILYIIIFKFKRCTFRCNTSFVKNHNISGISSLLHIMGG